MNCTADNGTEQPNNHPLQAIRISGFDSLTIRRIVEYAQTLRADFNYKPDETGSPTDTDNLNLYQAADYYDIQGLIESCLSYLFSTCTVANIIPRLVNKITLESQELQEIFFEFVSHRIPEIEKYLKEICPESKKLFEEFGSCTEAYVIEDKPRGCAKQLLQILAQVTRKRVPPKQKSGTSKRRKKRKATAMTMTTRSTLRRKLESEQNEKVQARPDQGLGEMQPN